MYTSMSAVTRNVIWNKFYPILEHLACDPISTKTYYYVFIRFTLVCLINHTLCAFSTLQLVTHCNIHVYMFKNHWNHWGAFSYVFQFDICLYILCHILIYICIYVCYRNFVSINFLISYNILMHSNGTDHVRSPKQMTVMTIKSFWLLSTPRFFNAYQDMFVRNFYEMLSFTKNCYSINFVIFIASRNKMILWIVIVI